MITQQTGRPGVKARHLSRILEQPFDVINFHNISLVGGLGVLRMGGARCKLYTLHEHWLLCPTHIFWKNRSHPCDRPTCLRCCLRSGIPPQLWRYTRLRDDALTHVDRLIAPSTYTAERHRAGGIRNQITVLPLFSALEDIAVRRQPAPMPRDPYFLYVGRVTEAKGIRSLVKTVAAAPEITLVVVGDGDLRPELASRYQACPNVSFLGAVPQDQLVDIYARARALILPSLAPETFGLTIIEAAAHGVPAIVRGTAGGAPEFVASSQGGAVYDEDGELRSLLQRFAREADHAADLGRRARAAYLRSYTRDTHLDAYLNLVEEVVAQKARRRPH